MCAQPSSVMSDLSPLMMRAMEEENGSLPPSRLNGSHPPGSGTPIDWLSKVGKEPPPRHWFIRDWLPPAPTLLAGMGGIGKTTLLQTLATALAFGRNFIGEIEQAARVLVWTCEDDDAEVWRRQIPICAHFGLDIGDLADRLHIVPRTGLDNVMLDVAMGNPVPTRVMQELQAQVLDLNIDVLVLDNLAHFFGGKESDRHQTTLFVNSIMGMVRDRPFAPILVGHTARSEGSEYSGSAAWENACRVRLYLGRNLPDAPEDEDEGDPDVIVLAKRKANYAAKDHLRLRFNGGLFVPEHANGVSLDPEQRKNVADQVLLKGFDRLIEMGLTCTDSANSQNYLPRKLIEHGLNQGHSKAELKAAMFRQMGRDVLKRGQVGAYDNRTPKSGLTRCNAGACTK